MLQIYIVAARHWTFASLWLAWLPVGCASMTHPSETIHHGQPKWRLRYREPFDEPGDLFGKKAQVAWRRAEATNESRFDDAGPYFTANQPHFSPPTGYRTGLDFGQDKWLRVESYTRALETPLSEMVSVVPATHETDPTNRADRMLRLRSGRHSDATVIRSRLPLPSSYKVCVRIGYIQFGTGEWERTHNGYDGDEHAGPWKDKSAVHENGVYWLAILAAPPKPHNNIWIHHHRKVVIDTDNNIYPHEPSTAWTRIWDGKQYVPSGVHPLMAFVLDSDRTPIPGRRYEMIGQPFISLSRGVWNWERNLREIRAVDAYKDNTWYQACIWRHHGRFGVELDGDFQFGGRRRYEGAIDERQVFMATEAPDYFMLGDPHINFYEGEALYDDIELYVPAPVVP